MADVVREVREYRPDDTIRDRRRIHDATAQQAAAQDAGWCTCFPMSGWVPPCEPRSVTPSAGFDAVVQVDADGQHGPAGIKALVEDCGRRRWWWAPVETTCPRADPGVGQWSCTGTCVEPHRRCAAHRCDLRLPCGGSTGHRALRARLSHGVPRRHRRVVGHGFQGGLQVLRSTSMRANGKVVRQPGTVHVRRLPGACGLGLVVALSQPAGRSMNRVVMGVVAALLTSTFIVVLLGRGYLRWIRGFLALVASAC